MTSGNFGKFIKGFTNPNWQPFRNTSRLKKSVPIIMIDIRNAILFNNN